MRRFIQFKGKTATPRLWEISVDGNKITSTWGELGGAMNSTTEACNPVNVGKKNEKSAEEMALKIAGDYIKKKTKKGGYAEVDPSTNEPLKTLASTDFDFNSPHLNSTSFRAFKPQNTMNAYMRKLVEAKSAWFSRKRDGYMHYVVVDDHGEIDIYSSNFERAHTLEPDIALKERFPMIMDGLRDMGLEPRTMLVGEICTSTDSGSDDYGYAIDSRPYVASILKSLTPLALEKQEESGSLAFCAWDIMFMSGEPWVKTRPVEERYEALRAMVPYAHRNVTVPELIHMEEDSFIVTSIVGQTLEIGLLDTEDPINDIVSWAKELKWEGFVVVDPGATYGEKSWSFHGKNERPKFVCKLKPDIDVDVIVRWDPENKLGIFGKGKHTGEVGSVQAFLWDEELGEVDVGRIGIGITDKQAKDFADPGLYPMVWKITCKGWTENGKLDHASLDHVRDDKGPEDCEYSQSPVSGL